MSQPTFKQLQASVRGGLSFNMSFIPPLAVVAGRINTLGTGISTFDEPLRRAIKEIVIPSIQTNFDVGGRPAWQPMSGETPGIAARMGSPVRKLLVRTGALKGAMGEVSSWNITNESASLYIPLDVWYGYIHQAGFAGKGGGQSAKGKSFQWIVKNASKDMPVSAIPQRPFAVLQPEDEADIQDMFMEWLGEKIEEAWP